MFRPIKIRCPRALNYLKLFEIPKTNLYFNVVNSWKRDGRRYMMRNGTLSHTLSTAKMTVAKTP